MHADTDPALTAFYESALGKDRTLRIREHVVFTRPKLVALRSFGVSHIAHHPGQLTAYLRLLDIDEI